MFRRERVQVSLNFETDYDLETYDEVIVGLKENKQLRSTILELLGLLKDKPLEVEALLNGENLVPQDDYAKNFLADARNLENKIQQIDLLLNEKYKNMSQDSTSDLLGNLSKSEVGVLKSNSNKPEEEIDNPKLDIKGLKEEISRDVVSQLLPNIKDMLDDFKSSMSLGISSDTIISEKEHKSSVENVHVQTEKPKEQIVEKPSSDKDNVSSNSKFRIFDIDEDDILKQDKQESSLEPFVEDEEDSMDMDYITKMLSEASEQSLG